MNKSTNNYESDVEIIKKQLKSDSVSVDEVISRCAHGYPAVIVLDPVHQKNTQNQNKKITPVDPGALSNVIWLTCPYLNEKIHDIESEGYIKKINDFINKDNMLDSMMNNAQAHYYYLRKRIYYKNFKKPENSNINIEILKSGIGGSKKADYLKCLHMHFAHYTICSNNVAGKIVYFLLQGKTACSEVMCANWNK